MPVIIDTGALLRPPFTAQEFVATKWDTADDKADFANSLCRFMAADFKIGLFTDKLYRRLSNTFGHIANYNKAGFISVFFENLAGKVDFLEQTLACRCWGDPEFTYSDVERAVLKRLCACHLLDAYRALRAAEIEHAEREMLRRLRGKYEGMTSAPIAAPILHPGASPKAMRKRQNENQAMLF